MFDSGCSRHMTGNKALLADCQDIDGDFVAFGGSARGWDTKIPQSGSPPIEATARTSANREVELTATIDGQVKTITEASLRRHLKLEDMPLSPNIHVSTSSTSQPPNTQPTPTAEEAVPMPQESPLHNVHSLRRDEGSVSLNELMDLCTSLSKKVGALENELQQTKKTYSTAITKLILRVKKLEQKVKTTKARRRARIVLLEDEEDVEDYSKQGRKISVIDKDPTISLVQPEQEMEHDVGIAEETTWFQEDAEIQEKNSVDTKIILQEEEPTELVEDQGGGSGKGIMTELEPEKKTKKQLEQERLRHEEAIRLQEQLNEEETQRIARDAEILEQLMKILIKQTRKIVAKDGSMLHVIDWSDHSRKEGYKINYFKGKNEKSMKDIRPIFEKVWDQNQYFVSMDSEDNEKGSKKKAGGSRRKHLPRKEQVKSKVIKVLKDRRHNTEKEKRKKTLNLFGSWFQEKNLLFEIDLCVTTEESYATSRPEGYDLCSNGVGDLKILFQPDEEDDVWKHQHEYNLISCRLFDSCGFHILLIENGIAIHMMIEKKYPLTQEMLSKMLSRKLEVDHENEMIFELLSYTNGFNKYEDLLLGLISPSMMEEVNHHLETSVRRALQLKDAEGTECLPNATIFEQLTLMGYENLTQKLTFYKAFFSPQWKFLIHTILQCLSAKTTAWNEFSSTMASAIICLATNQKFNFSKYIFDNMVKNLEVGKDTEVPQPSGSIKPITDEAANKEHVPIHSNDPLLSGEDRLQLKELLELCTKLFERVLDLENTKTSQAAEIAKLKERVKKLERRNKSSTPGLKRLRKVGRSARIESSEDEGLGAQEDASKQRRKITDIDADAKVTLVDEAQGRNDDYLMFDTRVFDKQEVEVEKVVSTVKFTYLPVLQSTTVDDA
ncbi:hypothetical protein Tco_0451990 [Tanacetum coccineum]